MTRTVQVVPDPARQRSRRLGGVDAARGLALIGMMSVHIFRFTDGPRAPLAQYLAAGRSAALFALLAGVGIALSTGGVQPPSGGRLNRARRAVAARAAVVATIGLTLAATGGTLLVILPYYGVLFLLAIPVLGWGSRRLAVLACVAALTTPVISHLLRRGQGLVVEGNVDWSDLLTEPAGTLRVLILTGTYPVLTWSTHLFAGLAVGRLSLARPSVARAVAVAGAGLAVVGWVVGQITLAVVGRDTVAAALPRRGIPVDHLDAVMLHSFLGAPPPDEWWWLGIQAPHIGTTPDLVHTTGTALLVLGVCLLVVRRAGGWARPLVAAGSMTLTLYTGHVLAVRAFGALDERVPAIAEWSTSWVFLLHVVAALVVATAWGSPERRGPLEALSSRAARRAAGEIASAANGPHVPSA